EVDLDEDQRQEIKGIAKELLDTLKEDRLIQDWKNTQETQAGVETTIKRTLAHLPGGYPKSLRQQKREEIYAHFYDNYEDAEHNVYARAG
ncbi:MAG: hypothetical protein BRC50_04285, partial [Cyanobacteria bacterium SW_11_48_12]